MVFPYNCYSKAIVDYSSDIKKYTIESLVGLPCDQCNDHDLVNGIEIKYNFESELSNVDIVLWVKSQYFKNDAVKSFILDKIKYALLNNKIIYCLESIDPSARSFLTNTQINDNNLVELPGSSHLFSTKQNGMMDAGEKPVVHMIIPLINLPILDEVSYQLRHYFTERGVRVSQVFNDGTGFLFGANAFPSFIESNQFDVSEKIKMFNNFLCSICQTEGTSEIVVSSPFSIVPINHLEKSDYGVLLNIITSLLIDGKTYVVLDCDDISDSYLDYIVNILKYRYNRNHVEFVVSNLHINELDMEECPNNVGFDVIEWDDVPKIFNLESAKYSISCMNKLNIGVKSE